VADARDGLVSAKADKAKAIASAKASLAAKEAEEGALERLLKEARRASRKSPNAALLGGRRQGGGRPWRHARRGRPPEGGLGRGQD
jgi:hypothetical protein